MNKFVSNGTVFQEAIYETTATSNSIISEKERRVIDLSDYRIRELDFKILNGNGPYEDNSYKSYVTSNELGLILSQKSSVISSKTMRWRNPSAVCLIASISINGKVQKLKKRDGYVSPHLYQIKLEDSRGFCCETWEASHSYASVPTPAYNQKERVDKTEGN
jgi:hypothetical protein